MGAPGGSRLIATNSLSRLPATALPPDGQDTVAIAVESLPVADRVLDLVARDVLPDPGVELVAAVDDGGFLSLVVWSIAGGLHERFRHTTCFAAGSRGAIETGDSDLDGVTDVAFASGGRVDVVAGPLAASATHVVWERVLGTSQEHPDLEFGFSLLAWGDGSLIVGHPGIFDMNWGTYQQLGGEVRQIAQPLQP